MPCEILGLILNTFSQVSNNTCNFCFISASHNMHKTKPILWVNLHLVQKAKSIFIICKEITSLWVSPCLHMKNMVIHANAILVLCHRCELLYSFNLFLCFSLSLNLHIALGIKYGPFIMNAIVFSYILQATLYYSFFSVSVEIPWERSVAVNKVPYYIK